MRGVPRWFAVLAVVAFGVLCAFLTYRAAAPAATAPGSANDRTTSELADSFGDGTPEFLRLHDAADRDRFRRWFTLIAESQYYRGEKPAAEVADCAALLRFSYREALRRHDSAWLSSANLPAPPRTADLQQYQFPYTPLRAAIFRVKDGEFRAENLSDGAFAEFADAKSLWRYNTYNVGHALEIARPGEIGR